MFGQKNSRAVPPDYSGLKFVPPAVFPDPDSLISDPDPAF